MNPWVPCEQVPLLSQAPHPVNYKIILGKAQKGNEKLLQTQEAPMHHLDVLWRNFGL